MPIDSISLLRELTSIPGPPGKEQEVAKVVAKAAQALGFSSRIDARGNLLMGSAEALQAGHNRIIVTAHMDELGLLVTGATSNGAVKVSPLGGLYPWKWGERAVSILCDGQPIDGVLSFGCIHTNSASSVAGRARQEPLTWEMVWIHTGLSGSDLAAAGVIPGVRVALHGSERQFLRMGDQIAAHFIDDRADLVSMLLAMEAIGPSCAGKDLLFAATVAEEVGGEGALWLMHERRPEICIALEIGPSVPESPIAIDPYPTVWVKDGYSTLNPIDQTLLRSSALKLNLPIHWQALSRGGSDATCSAAQGAVARPVTLGLPVENSHGLEVIHQDSIQLLADFLGEYLDAIAC